MTNFNEYFENKKINERYEDNNGVVYNEGESEREGGIGSDKRASEIFLSNKRKQLVERKKVFEKEKSDSEFSSYKLMFQIALLQIEDSIELIDYLSKNK